MHKGSYELFVKHGLPLITPRQRVLEVGPDVEKPGDPYSIKQALMAQGVEYYYTDLNCQGEGKVGDRSYVGMSGPYHIKVHTNRLDAVVSANVAEHVSKLWEWVKELGRILLPGGYLILINPLSWPYHEAPVDCWRIYPEGYKALFEWAGLEHVFSWHGVTVEQVEEPWLHEHGPGPVRDCIAVARKPRQEGNL